MGSQDIAIALQRAESVLRRRPGMGLHDDSPATARWDGGLRVRAMHANGAQFQTDMPTELGGSGDCVTPGWLLRAGLASCAATRIAMDAARAGIELKLLELTASSRSDTRAVLGMAQDDGEPIAATPRDVSLNVRIAADGVAPERLRALVETAHRGSPVPCAVREPLPIALHIEVID